MRDGLKMLGVIGGMGPKATSLFYDMVINHTAADCDQEHINMVILSFADFPDRTEAIKSGETGKMIAAFRNCARILKDIGCANLAIPCNTAHYYIDDIQKASEVPVINMVRETVDEAIERGAKKIGIMATEGTIQAGIYTAECRCHGVEAYNPGPAGQADVTSLIYDDVKSGRPCDPAKFDRVIEEFRDEGCDAVILACTELSVFKEEFGMPEFCIDAMDVLVRESIIRSGAEYK
ncbi:MAG: aspartate/glutamate racemase family protein [Lentihominibacter sp.]|jgi:aspartate racemase